MVIEKYRLGFLEGYPVFPDILTGLRLIPLKPNIVHMSHSPEQQVSFNPSPSAVSIAHIFLTHSQTLFIPPYPPISSPDKTRDA